ncbi:MAG TPA: transposase [Anaerolineae bacterium]|nr:transposase [Anaerolineae bacterium]
MRLPIVQFPRIIVENLGYFASVFQTTEQQKHFCEYVTGLIAGDKATVTAISALFLNKNDQSSLNKFMTQAQWAEDELNYRRVRFELERLYQRPVSETAGRLIVDDTLAHHTRCSMEGLAYLRDHSLGHNVWAHNVVTSYYVNRRDQFPVDFRLYYQFNQKYEQQVLDQIGAKLQAEPHLANYRQYLTTLLSYHYRQPLYCSKTQLGAELVRQAVDWALPFSVVLFDSWFLRWPLIETIQQQHKDWVAACPKDRLVLVQNRWVQLQEYIQTIPTSAYRPYKIGHHLYWTFTKVLPMKNLKRQRVRIVASYEDQLKPDHLPDFYATNRKDWEGKRILTTYLDRWPTETFNEDAKGNLGFEDYQLRQLRAIKRHWYLSFVAYSLLGDQGPPGRSRWAVRGRFQSTGQRCQAVVDELLEDLVHWIARQIEAGLTPDTILQTLLA